jgi:hypothetical protein
MSKPLHFNKPQLLSYLIRAKEEYAIWGRATGKSEGLISPRSSHNIHAMPRGNGVFVGATYQQILTRTLPAVIAGWERMGFKKDYHFFIGKKPPKNWKWPEAYISPLEHRYYIHWYNGAGIHLVSQDRPGSSNGLSIDWIIGDEAKLLKKEKLYTELFPANRGNAQHFGHLPEHHSMLFCTDMPTSSSGTWILDKEKDMDREQIDLILQVQLKVIELNALYDSANITQQKKILREIKKYEQTLNELRHNSVYYSEFSTLENIEALGVDFIKQQERNLPPIVFHTSILGKRLTKAEHGFYPLLSEDIHTYDQFDYSYLDSLDYNFDKLSNIDCLHDADINKALPLDIACDYGASINTLVVGQEHGEEYRFVKALFVKKPNLIQDVVQDFCKYYRQYPTKEVNFYYDHTAIGTFANSPIPFCDEVVKTLQRNGWYVNVNYIGQTPGPHSRYLLWGTALKEEDTRLPLIRFNRNNCKYLLISMQQAEVIQGRNGFEKNKAPERNNSIPQEETTHFSDAADTLLYAKYASRLQEHEEHNNSVC